MEATYSAEMASLVAGGVAGFAAMIFVVIYLVIILISMAAGICQLIGMWKVFEKAGESGWKAIIPFYNMYTLIKLVNRPGWWLILLFLPMINFVMMILIYLDLAKSFKQGTGFAVGLVFFPYIFMMILGFGKAEYVKLPREME